MRSDPKEMEVVGHVFSSSRLEREGRALNGNRPENVMGGAWHLP